MNNYPSLSDIQYEYYDNRLRDLALNGDEEGYKNLLKEMDVLENQIRKSRGIPPRTFNPKSRIEVCFD